MTRPIKFYNLIMIVTWNQKNIRLNHRRSVLDKDFKRVERLLESKLRKTIQLAGSLS